jgi:hypothetical protein
MSRDLWKEDLEENIKSLKKEKSSNKLFLLRCSLEGYVGEINDFLEKAK